jgi:hypothetical protein
VGARLKLQNDTIVDVGGRRSQYADITLLSYYVLLYDTPVISSPDKYTQSSGNTGISSDESL